MAKKRNKKFFIPLFICIAFLIVGIIGLIAPKSTTNLCFYNVDYSRHTGMDKNGFDAFLTIENKTETDFEDVSITIHYVVEHQLNYINESVTYTLDIDQGETDTSFTYNQSNFGIYLLDKIEKITFSYNGEFYEISEKSLVNLPNWGFIACCVIGFIGSGVSFVLWLSSNKEFVNPAVEHLKNFEERIKEAFKPAEPVEKKPERIVCHYCKCKYDAENHSKCPNCGAPPEPKD